MRARSAAKCGSTDPARLTLSLHPAIVVGDLHIANPPGFDGPGFAHIGELRLDLALLPLLRDELRVHELRGRDVAVRLTRASDGGGNWRFVPRAAADSRARLRLDIHRVALKNVLIEYAAGSTVRRFALAELAGEARADEPVRLMFRGTVDDRVAYTVDATGAPVAAFGGADPWPFDFRLAFPGTVVNGTGTMSGPLEGPAVRVTVGAGTKDLREVGTILELGLPAIGAALAAQFDLESGTARLGAINGVVGANAVSGELTLDTGGPRPKLSGRLTVPELDVRPFLARVPLGAAEEPATLAGAFRELEHVGFDPRQLASVDADVQVAVGHFAGPPGDPRDINANVRIDAGRLTAPLAATIAGARFEGDLAVDGTTTPPRMRAQLLARDAPLGRIAELLFDAPHVAGTVRRFEVRLDATGENVAALARDLEARIGIEDARLTYGNFAGGRPVAMRLDAAELRQPRGKTITAKLRGSLRGKSFDGTFRAGTVERILRERRTPFGFDGASGSVRARLSGTLAEPTATTGPEVAFDVAAPRARELTPWLGLSSESDTRVALKGTVRVTRRSASLTGGSLRIGRTSITGDVTSQAVGAKPLVRANLVAELLAPAELRTLVTPPGTAQRATLLEIPILPESLDFADSDMEVRVKRVDGLPLEITDIVFQGRMRAGEIAPSPFSLRVERNALAGALGLDARDDAPTASLWLAGDDFDVGPLLRRLRVARDIESRIGTVRFYAEIRERRLGDVLDQSSFVASIESGTLDVRDANSRAALRIGVDAGEVRANAGAPVTAAITGTIGTTPVALKAQAGRLREIVEADRRLPFSLAAETPAAKLAISGTAAPPRNPDVALALALTGARLDGLDTLLGTSLPPWGPYALTARLRFPKRGYDVEAIRLTLGESVLEGKGSLDTTLAPPKLDVALAAERIQLDDFPLGEWSPFGERAVPADPMTVETTRRAVAAGARRAHAIFSRERLGNGRRELRPGGEAGRCGQVRARARPVRDARGQRPGDDRAGRSREPGGQRAGFARLRAARARRARRRAGQRRSLRLRRARALRSSRLGPRRRVQPGSPPRRDRAAAVRRAGDRFRTLRLRGLAGTPSRRRVRSVDGEHAVPVAADHRRQRIADELSGGPVRSRARQARSRCGS